MDNGKASSGLKWFSRVDEDYCWLEKDGMQIAVIKKIDKGLYSAKIDTLKCTGTFFDLQGAVDWTDRIVKVNESKLYLKKNK